MTVAHAVGPPPGGGDRAGRKRQVADCRLQFHGGIGYIEDTWTPRFFRNNRLTGIGGRPDEVTLRTRVQTDGYTTS